MSEIKDLIESIAKEFEKNHFDKFIHEVTFPNFKKIKPFTKIDFKFPLTVLVGANGGGKSSILQALWGMPLGYSTNRFWFSTQIDPIKEELAGKPNIPRYWYSHFIKAINQKVQTRKVKGTKNNGYWEPSRPSVQDNMAKMPAKTSNNHPFMSSSGDRWTPVNKEPHYINTKSESSAFDRFFYHTELTKIKDRQDFFIRRSGKLHGAMQQLSTSINIGRGVFTVSQTNISDENLKTINRILRKNYKSAKKILHNLFDSNKSPSVIFETEAHTYSESFAGSGELAIVNLVLHVEGLKEFDLLLIDEPETSLHPGAQKELLLYLLQKTKDKKLQVVIATHSTTMVELLPEHALVVLKETDDGTIVDATATKSTAFYQLGHPDPNKVTFITEDRLLKAYLERAIEFIPNELRDRVDVWAASTGSSEMLSHQVPAYMNSGNARVVMVLDGDQKNFIDIVSKDTNTLSPQALNDVVALLITQCHVTIVGSDPDVPGYMKWCKKNVIAIEDVCPEKIFYELLGGLVGKPETTNQGYKKLLKNLLKNRGDEYDSKSQYALFKSKLRDAILNDVDNKNLIVKSLKYFSEKLTKIINNS